MCLTTPHFKSMAAQMGSRTFAACATWVLSLKNDNCICWKLAKEVLSGIR